MEEILNQKSPTGQFHVGTLEIPIERIVGSVMEQHDSQAVESLEQLDDIDRWARARAHEICTDVMR